MCADVASSRGQVQTAARWYRQTIAGLRGADLGGWSFRGLVFLCSSPARSGWLVMCRLHAKRTTMSGMKLKLDLHDIYNRGGDIDRALQAIINEAVATKAPLVEIIPGKGSGALKKRVLRFLEQKEIKSLYHRVEKDSNNFGRIFVHFRWK
jgi:hypothetical protein